MTKAGWFPPIFGQMYTLNVIIVAVLPSQCFSTYGSASTGMKLRLSAKAKNTARYAEIT
jgi:simple sugar transport system permease protein